jgi:DNA-directed RNA polymerase subunit K/omega
MRRVRLLLSNAQAVYMVAAHFGEPVSIAHMQVARAEQIEMQAGF